MLNQLLRFVLDREPVQTAAGLAGVITATVGLLESFEILSLTPAQVGAIGLFVTAAAGWLARRRAYAPATVERVVARPPESG